VTEDSNPGENSLYSGGTGTVPLSGIPGGCEDKTSLQKTLSTESTGSIIWFLGMRLFAVLSLVSQKAFRINESFWTLGTLFQSFS